MTKGTVDLLIRIDSGARETLQEQIYASIRQAILARAVAPGARLPSSRELAENLGVSRTTTLLALDQLVAEGYVTTRPASGMFVTQELPDDLPPPQPHREERRPPPPLSRRGALLSETRQGAVRLPGPPCAFRLGTPALDLFPVSLWSRLASRRLRSISSAELDYGDPAGLLSLRGAIAEYVRTSRGTTCEPDQIVMVAGAQQGLGLVCRLLLDPGEAAWLEEPGYPGARSALVGAGARIVPVPVDADGLDVKVGQKRAVHARVAYVTPSHQYPLGIPMSLPRRLPLLQWARRAQAWIIEDDYDSEFRHRARPIPCLHGLEDGDDRVIYVGSFSKTLFPSLRLGFLIVPSRLRTALIAVRASADQHPPVLEQLVLSDFINEGHFAHHLRRMRVAYRERLRALNAAAERLLGGSLRLHPTSTGLHAVGDLDHVPDVEVVEEAAKRGVEVAPLSAYFAARPRANGLLLGFGAVAPAEIERGMERLAAAIKAVAR